MNVAFFVTGMGRSGTKWLASLLDKAPNVRVYHEPFFKHDRKVYRRFYVGKSDPQVYLSERAFLMGKVWLGHQELAWGEVNSYLRYCVPAVRDFFEALVVGLVRDGRYTVRSIINRGVFHLNHPLKPLDPELQARWNKAGQFGKVCWYWADAYERLIADGVRIFKLEQLNQDYRYFLSLCNILGIYITHPVWASHACRPVNVGIWDDARLKWDGEQQSAFRTWAGEIQDYFGYEA